METPDRNQLPDDIRLDLADVLRQMPGGFFIYHADGDEELVYANGACLRIFGCETLEQFKALTGYTFKGMVYPDDFDEVERSITRQIDESDHNLDYVEYRIVQRDGTVRWIEDYGRFVQLSSGDYYYVFINDATDKLRERMAELEAVNEKLNAAFEREQEHRRLLREALNQANSANIAKTAFLNNMSHDIRTLLNAVVGYTQLIRDHATEGESVVAPYADKVLEASDQLLDVMSETLEVSRMEAGRAQLAETDCSIAHLAEEAFAHHAAAARSASMAYELDIDAIRHDRVRADATRLVQIMDQLLDNAIKYTPQGGHVSLRVEELPVNLNGYARYRLTVADNGKGMHEAFMERMYDPFEREMNTTQGGVVGTGLGLCIVRHSVDLLAGSLDVQSAPGRGTVFTATFSLKLQEGHDEPKAAVVAARTLEDFRHVLLVEDNLLNREIATCLLEDAGFTVDFAENGQEAVDAMMAAEPGTFDLVLMDIQMPVMDGYEATRRIRALDDPRRASVPIIAVTADALAEARKRSLDSGMNAHLAKPLTIRCLRETIRGLLD